MKTHVPPPARRPRGVTLVSLMTGLAVSMVLVLATLMLFQRMVRASSAARGDALADAQRSAAFLAAGMAVQEAGFGIAAPQAGTHLVVLSGAALNGGTLSGSPVGEGTEGNAVVWAEAASGTTRCTALLSPTGSGQGGLRRLGPAPCADATAWAGLAWTAAVLSDAPAAPVALAWQAGACRPFGIAGTAGHVLLTLRAVNSNGVALRSSQCLANFPS